MVKRKTTTANNAAPETPTLSDADREFCRSYVANAITLRTELFNRLTDRRRNIPNECGYPENVMSVSPWDYQNLYDREAIAARVVEVLPKESWQVTPTIYEKEKLNRVTPFEVGWDSLGQSLRPEKSYHKDEEGSNVWEILRRADIQSGIGQYGCVFLGLGDGQSDLSKPAVPKPGMKLTMCRVFPEAMAQITEYERVVTNPRFGHPTMYLLTFNDPREQHSGVGMPIASRNVHWSRVVHVADNLGSNEVFGVPRQRPVLRRLLDLEKLYGSDPEAFWQGCFMGLSLETVPELGGEVTIPPDLKDMIENYMNGFQRYLALTGMSAKTLAPAVVDPTTHIQIQIAAICIKLGIPMRIFMGSERGELASSQDDKAWNDRVKERQLNYLTPRLIAPFVDRLISLGVLPTPALGYHIEWPDVTSQSAEEKATVFEGRMRAYASYMSGNVATIMTPMEMYTREAGYSEEEARAIIESAMKHEEDELTVPSTTPHNTPIGSNRPTTPMMPTPNGAVLQTVGDANTREEDF